MRRLKERAVPEDVKQSFCPCVAFLVAVIASPSVLGVS